MAVSLSLFADQFCWFVDIFPIWDSPAIYRMMTLSGVPRGDAQDARASPPPPQPERLVMRKDEAVGNKKKCNPNNPVAVPVK
jgi:hypothetical protein